MWAFLKKAKNRTTIWSKNLTSRYTSKGNEITISKRYLHSQVSCSIHNNQDLETNIHRILITAYLSIYLGKERNTVWSHLHLECQSPELRNTRENGGCRGWGGVDKMEDIVVRGYKLSVIRWVSSGDLSYGVMTVVNNTVLYSWKLLRVEF